MSAPVPPPAPATAPRRRWRAARRILIGSAVVATLVAFVGWFGAPLLAAGTSLLIAIVGIPAALAYSVYLIVRRRALPENFWQNESRRVAFLVMTLILLVPANLVPTAGKRRLLKMQGRDAVHALEAHFREHGSFPERIGDASGAPWVRAGLSYDSTGQDYRLWFEDPGFYYMDSAYWRWDRGAGGWRYFRVRF